MDAGQPDITCRYSKPGIEGSARERQPHCRHASKRACLVEKCDLDGAGLNLYASSERPASEDDLSYSAGGVVAEQQGRRYVWDVGPTVFLDMDPPTPRTVGWDRSRVCIRRSVYPTSPLRMVLRLCWIRNRCRTQEKGSIRGSPFDRRERILRFPHVV